MMSLSILGAMTTLQTGLFGLVAALAVLAAIAVVLHRNPVVEGLFLVLHLIAVAGLYVMLDAHFFAVIQVLIYVGAVMVLIIFVIMLLNLQPEAKGGSGLVPAFFALVLGVGLVSLLVRAELAFAPASEGLELAEGFGSVAQMGAALFGGYFYPFEVVSLALVAAMAGAVVLAKRQLEG